MTSMSSIRKSLRRAMMAGGGASIYVKFKDPEVERVLLEHGVGNDGRITYAELAAVTDIGTWFNGNTEIREFPELSLTNVTSLGNNAFYGCTSLSTIGLNNIQYLNGLTTFDSAVIKKIYAPNCKNFGYAGYGSFTIMSSIIDCVFIPSAQKIAQAVSKSNLVDAGQYLREYMSYTSKVYNFKDFIVRSLTTLPVLGGGNDAGWNGDHIFVYSSVIEEHKTSGTFKRYANKIFAIGGAEWQAAMRSLADQYASEYAGWTATQISSADYSDPYIDYDIFGVPRPE